jgi:hypothetical protein
MTHLQPGVHSSHQWPKIDPSRGCNLLTRSMSSCWLHPLARAGDLAQKLHQSTPKRPHATVQPKLKNMTRKWRRKSRVPFPSRRHGVILIPLSLSHSGVSPKGSPPQHCHPCRRSVFSHSFSQSFTVYVANGFINTRHSFSRFVTLSVSCYMST